MNRNLFEDYDKGAISERLIRKVVQLSNWKKHFNKPVEIPKRRKLLLFNKNVTLSNRNFKRTEGRLENRIW